MNPPDQAAEAGKAFLGLTKVAWSIIISLVALAQPWVVWLHRRFFRRGVVEVFPTGLVEVGYSGFGPTIGLFGTLRVLHEDLFVHRIALVLEREKDGAQHEFDWAAFRSPRIPLAATPCQDFELPTAFLLTLSNPRQYNVIFNDTAGKAEQAKRLAPLREDWFRSSYLSAGFRASGADIDKLYESYRNQPIHTNAYSYLERACYWEEGAYVLTMNIHTHPPRRVFSKKWSFVLSAEQAGQLRLNAIRILWDTCGIQGYGSYNFVYSEYRDIT